MPRVRESVGDAVTACIACAAGVCLLDHDVPPAPDSYPEIRVPPPVNCPALEDGACECGRHGERRARATIIPGARRPVRDEVPGSVGDAIARAAEQFDAAAVPVAGGGLRFDTGKVPVELLPPDALEEVARVLEFGAKKYARRNWEKGMLWSRVIGPLLRHAFRWLRGEDNDPETGLNHMAHVACNALFLVAYIKRGAGTDDRNG